MGGNVAKDVDLLEIDHVRHGGTDENCLARRDLNQTQFAGKRRFNGELSQERIERFHLCLDDSQPVGRPARSGEFANAAPSTGPMACSSRHRWR